MCPAAERSGHVHRNDATLLPATTACDPIWHLQGAGELAPIAAVRGSEDALPGAEAQIAARVDDAFLAVSVILGCGPRVEQ